MPIGLGGTEAEYELVNLVLSRDTGSGGAFPRGSDGACVKLEPQLGVHAREVAAGPSDLKARLAGIPRKVLNRPRWHPSPFQQPLQQSPVAGKSVDVGV